MLYLRIIITNNVFMAKKSANERTFQGELMRMINKIISDDTSLGFSKITQEENVGVKGKAKFADGILYSAKKKGRKFYFELKNTSWDATDELLVSNAMQNAMINGVEYVVTGTPRQLVIYETFKPDTTVRERKLKIYNLSNVRKDDDVLNPIYEKEIFPKLKIFLKELSQIVHGEVRKIQWDSIDKYFVNKLSTYILEASADMFEVMYEKITLDKKLQAELRAYFKDQDIFNVTFAFTSQDIYNLCQLTNYLLYLKLLFYSYLQREVPELHLSKIEIPEDITLLNARLRARFDEVLKHDFEQIFQKNVLDSFEFSQDYLPFLCKNVEEMEKLNFQELNADIIGAIYNTLIDNQEQHDRGQHFTNTNEVDIVSAFCINEKTEYLLDSGCGAGTFLVRGYHFLKKYNPTATHNQLLERVWGIEIASFPAFLATMNLCLQNVRVLDNFPLVIQSDFSEIKHDFSYSGYFLNTSNLYETKTLDNKKAKVKMPLFHACIGNPPYIREKLITNKQEWNDLANIEQGVSKINQKADLYVYYLMHTATFLRENGRLGYVIASSWLDVSYGKDLQKYLLDNFKIIAIIDHQKQRSFDTAAINTVIVILEKNHLKPDREANTVRFIRFYADYEKYIGKTEDTDRFEKANTFAKKLESIQNNTECEDYEVLTIKQNELEEASTENGKYENGNWGAKYLRAPKIFNKIMAAAKNKMIPLSEVAEVKYGLKTGANEFFYLTDETEKAKEMSDIIYRMTFGAEKKTHLKTWHKYGYYLSELTNEHFILERTYLVPLFKNQKDANKLEINVGNLKYCVLMCQKTKQELKKAKQKVLEYIEYGEQHEIDKRPSCSSRNIWYNLFPYAVVGDFIFPSKIGEHYRLLDNRETKLYCDKVSYAITVNPKYNKDIVFLLMNSICFRMLIDLFSRQLTGAQTLSDVDVNVVEKTLILNPDLLKNKQKELQIILDSMKSRVQGTIFEEVDKADRKKLDLLIMKALGLGEKEREELYEAAVKYVADRKIKSESVKTTKTKKGINIEDSIKLITERFPEIENYLSLVETIPTTCFTIPEGKGNYPKTGNGNTNLFNSYEINFIGTGQKETLVFANAAQVVLMQFLNQTLGLKKVEIDLPDSGFDCNTVLEQLQNDYNAYFPQIQALLKTVRSKATALSVYKMIVFK